MEDTTSWRDLPIVLVRRTTSFNDLPIELIEDILIRLPVKTLIRSSLVNKSWYTLIRNPKFISLHLNHSISIANRNGNHYFLLASEAPLTNSCSLISERTYNEVSEFKIPFLTESAFVRIYGSCNGLICLGDRLLPSANRDFYLWNPLVEKYKHIESSSYVDLFTDTSNTYHVIGFGFHEAANDYRVVRIFYRGDDRGNCFGDLEPRVEVYSLRSNSWRRVSSNVPRFVYHARWVFVNGSVYWLEFKRISSIEWIMSFDVKNEVFREFQLPGNLRVLFGKGVYVGLLQFKGLVSVCAFDVTGDYGGTGSCSVWVMRENGGSVSWVEQYKVVLKVLGRPLMFTKSGELILQTSNRVLVKLVLWDLEKLQYIVIAKAGPYTVDASFVESLVLFEGGKFSFKPPKLAAHGFS